MPLENKPLKLFVASTVYNHRDLLRQICGILKSYGYEVINSEYGTLYHPFGQSNLNASLNAVKDCDIFFGIINPFYSSGITHQEIKRAIELNKPRRFMVHSFVTFSRKLLEQFMYSGSAPKIRTNFKIEKTSVMDDIRVIDMYNEVIQNDITVENRRDHWVQEYFRADEAFQYISTIFSDVEKVKKDLKKFKSNT
jgi:hypothetical protein